MKVVELRAGAYCNSNVCLILFSFDLMNENYGKILGQAGVIFVLDKFKKIIKKIEVKNHGFSGAIPSDDGKYIMISSGGLYGEGGGLYVQERLKIYEVNTAKVIFSTDKIKDHNGVSQLINLFKVRQFFSEKGGSTFYVFVPEKRMVYYLDISGDQISEFWEWKKDGIYLRDGSALLYERDFKKSNFSSF